MSNQDSFWCNQLRRLRDRFAELARTGRRYRLRICQNPLPPFKASLAIDNCPDEPDRLFFEPVILDATEFGRRLHRSFVLCRLKSQQDVAGEDFCNLAAESAKLLLEAPVNIRRVFGTETLSVRKEWLRWSNAVFTIAWARPPGTVLNAERFVLVEPDFVFPLTERKEFAHAAVSEEMWRDWAAELTRLRAQLRQMRAARRSDNASAPKSNDDAPDFAELSVRYSRRRNDLEDIARSRIPKEPDYFASFLPDAIESSIAAINWLVAACGDGSGEPIQGARHAVALDPSGSAKIRSTSLRELIYTVQGAESYQRRATEANERAKASGGSPIIGSPAAYHQRTSSHWMMEANKAIVTARAIAGADELRTLCIVRIGTANSAAMKRIAAEAALANGMTMDELMELDVQDALRLICASHVSVATTSGDVGNASSNGGEVIQFGTDGRRTGVAETACDEAKPNDPGCSEFVSFTGGEMVFYFDRVELCGAVICRASRGRRGLNALRLLAQKENGEFVASSAEELATRTDTKHGPGLIRGLRARIRTELAAVGIPCSAEDVILSGGPGYRLANSISVSVQCDAAQTEPEILVQTGMPTGDGEPVIEPVSSEDDSGNSADEPVSARLDEPLNEASDAEPEPAATTKSRQDAILHLLGEGQGLRVPAIAAAIGYSASTAKRDVAALVNAGKIRFDGAPKTGGYSVIRQPDNHAVKRRSRSDAKTSASDPNAEST